MDKSLVRIPLLLILIGLALPCAATPAATNASNQGGSDLDEVAVIGKKLRQLQREMIQAEDRFYQRFNALNTKDDFDIHCRLDKATGTLVPKRQCRTRFLVDAGAIDGQEFFRGLTLGTSARGVNTPLATLQPVWLERRDEYRQTAKSLLEKDPELLALATDWVRKKELYDRVHKERHQDRLVRFE